MDVQILPNERIDDLQIKGYRIIQDPGTFCFGIDAVLLSHFAKVEKGAKVVDLGTGNGIIPILLCALTEASQIVGIEIQPRMAEMAERSVKLNNLEERIRIINENLIYASKWLKQASYQVVVTNPPYMNKGGGLVNPESAKAIARHEITCTLEDIIKTGHWLLEPGGGFFMIHKPERLTDIICLMRNYKLEPKRIQFVHPHLGQKPAMVLVEGLKGGNPYINVEPPLFIHNPDGSYTAEINRIYGREDL